MVRCLSPEEYIKKDQELLEEIRKALTERTGNGYPDNIHLSNVLWHIIKLWKDGR